MLENQNSSAKKIFWVFTLCQFFFWSFIPAIFFKTIPLDTAEGIAWGYEWQWGYYKHPPLAAWLSNLAVVIQGYPGALIYIIAQLCIVVTFFAVWKLIKELMDPVYAVISVLCLSTIYYFSFPSIALNPNIVSFPLSALIILYVYKVTKRYSIWSWIIIGILAGLSILRK